MPKTIDGKLLFTPQDLKPIVEADCLLDGTKGGLILGNSHLDGGINVITQYQNYELYEVIAEVEGWEFIMSPHATAKHLEYIKKINAEFKDFQINFSIYEFDQNIDIIDTRPIYESIHETNKWIILGEYTQFIVNRNSTKKYLLELDKLNKKYCR